jgi:hypothetical protein
MFLFWLNKMIIITIKQWYLNEGKSIPFQMLKQINFTGTKITSKIIFPALIDSRYYISVFQVQAWVIIVTIFMYFTDLDSCNVAHHWFVGQPHLQLYQPPPWLSQYLTQGQRLQ